MNRFTLVERIGIECGIYQKLKLSEIAKKIGKTPGSVSREIRANRTVAPGEHPCGKDCCFAGECKTKGLCGKMGCSKRCVACREYDCRELCSRYNNTPCSILSKPPYVCNTCVRRRKCKADRAYYIAQQADAMAKRRYSNSRSKIQTRGEELEKLDELVSPLILKGQPLTHIWSEHGEELSISQRTLYRYIDQGVLSVGNIDLRRKVAYKPRRKKKEASEGFLNQEFRKNRGYDDYLKYMEKHPDTPVIQMDTVKGCREQGKRLLTIHFCNTNMITTDHYGRKIPKHAHGTKNLKEKTSSSMVITENVLELYDRIVDPNLLVRRITMTANHLTDENEAKNQVQCEQLSMFTDYEADTVKNAEKKTILQRERSVQEAMLDIKKKFGKNAILKGTNLQEGATAKNRNGQIDGHKA